LKVQIVAKQEASLAKPLPIPDNGVCHEEYVDMYREFGTDLNTLKLGLVPKVLNKAPTNLDDYQVFEAFQNSDGTIIKALLYNAQAEFFLMPTSKRGIPPSKNASRTYDNNWRLFNVELTASPAIWRAFQRHF